MTKQFYHDGELFVTVTETLAAGGNVIVQEHQYAPHAAPYEGAEPGVTTVNVWLADFVQPTEANVDSLVKVWQEQCDRAGFRSAGRDSIDAATAFLKTTGGRGALWATTAKPRETVSA